MLRFPCAWFCLTLALPSPPLLGNNLAAVSTITALQVSATVLENYISEADNILQRNNSDIEANAPSFCDRVLAATTADSTLQSTIRGLRSVYDNTPMKTSSGVNLDPGKHLIRGIKLELSRQVGLLKATAPPSDSNGQIVLETRQLLASCEAQLRDLQSQHTSTLRELVRVQGLQNAGNQETHDEARLQCERELRKVQEDNRVLSGKFDALGMERTRDQLNCVAQIAELHTRQLTALVVAVLGAIGAGWAAAWWLRVVPRVREIRRLRRQLEDRRLTADASGTPSS